MDFIETYYPFFLYAIPYVIAAIVLIRAKQKRVQKARDEVIQRHRIRSVVETPETTPAFGTRSITKFLQKMSSRKAA